MAGQKSGKAPGKTPYAPGGAEVWSDSNRDYFGDKYFGREASMEQGRQQTDDLIRLWDTKDKQGQKPEYKKGGIVGPNVAKWGSPKVTAPCKDTKVLKCY